MEIFEAGAPVNILSNGRRLPAEVIRYEADADRYIVRMTRSGDTWNADSIWVQARKVRNAQRES